MSEVFLDLLSIVCIIIISILVAFIIIKLIDYEVYVSNNLSEANDKRYEYDFASIKEYEMIVSRLDIQLYTRYIDGNDIIDESHLIFNGRMMILYPVSYFKFIRRLKNKNRKRKRIKGLWKSYLK
ncbi:MAG: hypothetical protein ACLRVD_09095 [Blautia caecimuris]